VRQQEIVSVFFAFAGLAFALVAALAHSAKGLFEAEQNDRDRPDPVGDVVTVNAEILQKKVQTEKRDDDPTEVVTGTTALLFAFFHETILLFGDCIRDWKNRA
jgi:hypothetical protein